MAGIKVKLEIGGTVEAKVIERKHMWCDQCGGPHYHYRCFIVEEKIEMWIPACGIPKETEELINSFFPNDT